METLDSTAGQPQDTHSVTPPKTALTSQSTTVTRYDFTEGDVRKFRPDIQGLRAVAVLLVVLYHAGVPGITGGYVGVDVFFVISGFLITRQLIGEARSTDKVSLSRFYARRIRRLLPLALLVIVVTVIAARIWGPVLEATSVAKDGLFASIYASNYWLAFLGVDYQTSGTEFSPLRHFWSLAIEEQYYILWPVIVAAIVWITRRRLRALRLPLLVVVLCGAVYVSLQQSIALTVSDAPLAYYSLQTRGWELAIGALVAVCVPLLKRVPSGLAAAISWCGLAAILLSAIVFNDSSPFPGTLALVPVIGAACIVASGLVERRGSVETLLGNRVPQFLGATSYGWYLWHWPFILLAPFIFGVSMGWPELLEMSFLALWAAVLTHLLVERPLNRGDISRRRWFLAGSLLTISSLVISTLLMVLPPPTSVVTAANVRPLVAIQNAASLADRIAASAKIKSIPSNIEPSLNDAASDLPVTTEDGCHLGFEETLNPACVFGDPNATKTMLLVGDSHAEQWFGAVDAIAKKEHWRLISWTKAACPIANEELWNSKLKRSYSECTEWRSAIVPRISELKPDLIIAAQADSLDGFSVPNDEWAAKTAETLRALKNVTASLIFLADTPHPAGDTPGCLAAHSEETTSCAVSETSAPLSTALNQRRVAVLQSVKALGVPVIDPTPWFCASDVCPAIVADTLVYRDSSHMTQHYSVALAPVLEAELARLDSTFTTSEVG